MPAYLCLSVTFLDGEFHGRRDGGESEWPPSPLRLFQALVATAAARGHHESEGDFAVPALRWLEVQPPPIVVTPEAKEAMPYRLSVPNNAMDIVARALTRGNDSNQGDANPATHRAMKTVRPTRLLGGETVSFLWPLPDSIPEDVRGFLEVITSIARAVVAVGWGIDLVAGHGRTLLEEEAARLTGERWLPIAGSANDTLRIPNLGTLDALRGRHEAFLTRINDQGLASVPPLTTFRVVGYRRDTDPSPRPYAAFALLKPDASGNRPFDPGRHTATVAGMVRHAVAGAAERAGWDRERIASYVHGHNPDGGGPARGGPDLPRFSYLPLPSLETRRPGTTHVGAIRRVLITAPPGEEASIHWLRRALSGQDLIGQESSEPMALLSVLPATDWVVKGYVDEAVAWSTVSPVLMTGYDDNNSAKAERLLRKALVQGGISPDLAASAQLEWRRVGFRAGVDLATRYTVPACLNHRGRYHLLIRWVDAEGRAIKLRGPLAFGAGRYGGFGLLAAHLEEGRNG